MEIFLFAILTVASGAIVTSIGCRRAQTQRRRSGWHLILLANSFTVLLTMLYVGQADLFRPAQWNEHKGGASGFWRPIIFASGAAAAIAVLASVAVLLYFRARYREVKPRD